MDRIDHYRRPLVHIDGVHPMYHGGAFYLFVPVVSAEV